MKDEDLQELKKGKVEIVNTREMKYILEDLASAISSEAGRLRRTGIEEKGLGIKNIQCLSAVTKSIKDIQEIQDREITKLLVEMDTDMAVDSILSAMKKDPDLKARLIKKLMENDG